MAQHIYNMADAWNAGGTTFTAIKMDITDTASAADSKFLAFLRNSAKIFDVTKDGSITIYNPSDEADFIKFWKDPGTPRRLRLYIGHPTVPALQFSLDESASVAGLLTSASNRLMIENTTAAIVFHAANAHFEFEGSQSHPTIDIVCYRAASSSGRTFNMSNVGHQGTIAVPGSFTGTDNGVDLTHWYQSPGGTHSFANLKLAVDKNGGVIPYNFTDAARTNYERGFMRWNSNVLEIGTEAGGTGTVRPMSFPNADIRMANLPTTDPGVAGRLWNDNGTLKISAGV